MGGSKWEDDDPRYYISVKPYKFADAPQLGLQANPPALDVASYFTSLWCGGFEVQEENVSRSTLHPT